MVCELRLTILKFISEDIEISLTEEFIENINIGFLRRFHTTRITFFLPKVKNEKHKIKIALLCWNNCNHMLNDINPQNLHLSNFKY